MATTSLDQVRELVRAFLRDFPDHNRLIGGEETSNPGIDLAIILALDDFNFATAPFIGASSISSFPSLSILVQGAVIFVLKSAGIGQSRNFLNFSSGGVSAVLSDRTAAYQSWINVLKADYETAKARLKAAQNLEQGFGGVASGYSGLSHYLGGSEIQGVLQGFAASGFGTE